VTTKKGRGFKNASTSISQKATKKAATATSTKSKLKSNSKKVKKQKKGGRLHTKDCVCAEYYCDLLYFSARMQRCPYPHSSEALAEADSCIQGCINTSCSKYGTAQDFSFTRYCPVPHVHAKMGIKEGRLTNSNHCLHASLEGPERCTSGTVEIPEAATLSAGRVYFYDPSSYLRTARN